MNVVSPHTRGSTATKTYLFVGEGGFPAHAGIDLSPLLLLLQGLWFPRTRGDRPYRFRVYGAAQRVSPHTRGST